MEVKGWEGKHLSYLMAKNPQSQENGTHGFDLRSLAFVTKEWRHVAIAQFILLPGYEGSR
jgi:hypothetical protein